MKVCYFGTYDPAFVRNATIIKGLRQNGVEVIECNRPAWTGTEDKLLAVSSKIAGLGAAFRLAWCYALLAVRYVLLEDHHLVIVGYAGHLDVFLAKLLAIARRKPVVLDIFLSLHETAVEDRCLVSKQSKKSRLLWLIDRYACVVSDLVLLDTTAHIDYFVEEFQLPRSRFCRVLATTDDSDYRPAVHREPSSRFRVIYFGQFIPLHGVEHIIGAAAILATHRDIAFVLYGTGQLLSEMKARASSLGLHNVEFEERWVSPRELSEIIDEYDLCLGIFGGSGKALRVIPNKVFVAMAKSKPVLSGDSPAMREIFTSGDSVLLCQSGTPAAIADAVIRLKQDKNLRDSLAENGLAVFQRLLAPKAIGATLVESLEMTHKRRGRKGIPQDVV